MLLRYARAQFVDPNAGASESEFEADGSENFYSDEDSDSDAGDSKKKKKGKSSDAGRSKVFRSQVAKQAIFVHLTPGPCF